MNDGTWGNDRLACFGCGGNTILTVTVIDSLKSDNVYRDRDLLLLLQLLGLS